MQIRLTDGTTLKAINTTGQGSFIQGAKRDTLSFQFAKRDYTIDELDKAFIPENCSKITLIDGNTESVHENYCIRASLTLAPIEVMPETSTTPAATEERITVTMAQKIYSEVRQDALEAQIKALSEKMSAEEK